MLDQRTLELLTRAPTHGAARRWLTAIRTQARPCPMHHPQTTRTTVITAAQVGQAALDGLRQFLTRPTYHRRLRRQGELAITAAEQGSAGFTGAHSLPVTTGRPHMAHSVESDDGRVVIGLREDGRGKYVATAIVVAAATSAIAVVAIVETGSTPCARCALSALRVGLRREWPVPLQTLRRLEPRAIDTRVQLRRVIRNPADGLQAAMLAYLPEGDTRSLARALEEVIPRALSRRTTAAMAPAGDVGVPRLRAPSAAVIATGSELLYGRDLNRPFLGRALRQMGLQLGGSAIAPDDPTAIIRFFTTFVQAGVRLLITTGGTGATRDDTTVQAAARFAKRRLVHDPDLEQLVLAREREERRGRRGWNEAAMRDAAHRQSRVPNGAITLEPVGTAPGFVMTARRPGCPVVVVLPGPPAEMQAMWERALETAPVRALLLEVGRRELRQLRLFGQEADLQTWIDSIILDDPEVANLELGTFWEGGQELRVDAWFSPDDRDVFDRFSAALRERVGERLYSPDGRTIEEIVAGLLGDRTIAAVESGTAGGTRSLLRAAGAEVTGGIKLSAAHPDVLLKRGRSRGEPAPPSAGLARGHARCARSLLGCDIGVGVAGPGRVPTDPTHIYVVIDDGARRTEATLTYPPDEAAIAEYARPVLHVVRAHLLGAH